jgi:hypothetical protein
MARLVFRTESMTHTEMAAAVSGNSGGVARVEPSPRVAAGTMPRLVSPTDSLPGFEQPAATGSAGIARAQSEPQAPSPSNACASCGFELEIGARFCSECGSRVPDSLRPRPPVPQTLTLVSEEVAPRPATLEVGSFEPDVERRLPHLRPRSLCVTAALLSLCAAGAVQLFGPSHPRLSPGDIMLSGHLATLEFLLAGLLLVLIGQLLRR